MHEQHHGPAIPFPLLAIQRDTNASMVLHGITIFYLPLGVYTTHNPATGATLAFTGEATQPGRLPPLARLLATALHNAQLWPAATDEAINTTTAVDTNMLTPTPYHNLTTSWLLPITPLLLQFFTTRTTLLLLQLCKHFLHAYQAAEATTQPLLALTADFLHAAITMDEAEGTINKSQLAMQLKHIPFNQILTNWVAARYAIYPMLLPPLPPPHNDTVLANPQQPPPREPLPLNNETQQNQLEPPPIPPAQNTQQIAITQTDTMTGITPATTRATAYQPFDEEWLTELVVNAVEKTMHHTNQQQRPPPMAALDTAIPAPPGELTRIDRNNLLSWCGVSKVEHLPPF